MEDIEELRRLLREEQRRRQEEQRRREEAESRALEEQRRRKEFESRALEEQRLREESEELAEKSRPQTLPQYLEACHSLSLAIRVVTESSGTTQGYTTDPTGRIFPRRIVPWDDFAARQEEVWDSLSVGDLFSSRPAFPSQHQLDYVKSILWPISSELGLRDFERNAVEDAVQKLVNGAYMDPVLRSSLGLKGTVTFESHLNLGTIDDDPISEPMKQMSLGTGRASASASAFAPKPLAAPKARRRARGRGNLADQFCIYRTSDGTNIPALAIEYKAPHKLSIDQIVTGLESEIQPERDVINKDGQGFAFTARALTAAVVTQLFSYMIGKSIQYGYVCTGEAFIFLHIPDDPATVYFSVCVPNLDVMEDDETRLHRTAVAQVFAFIIQALRAKPPPESWHDEAEKLGTWAVEYDDILRRIPETERKRKEPRASPYKPSRWKGFKRSPIQTRSYCQQLDARVNRPEDDDDDDNQDPPSPSPKQPRTGGKVVTTGVGSAEGGRKSEQRPDEQQAQGQAAKPNIQSRPFCTQQCLLGLASGGPKDENCPNSDDHGQEHISRLEFLSLIRHQLATDRGRDADCVPLYLSGARGSLFKVRLSAYGYTLVAKGVEGLDRACLQHENEMYNRLQAIQGKHVPVCLGNIDLILPYYYDCGVYKHFLFLSWAGQPLHHCGDKVNSAGVADAVATILKAVHKLQVLHRDAEPRNILLNTGNGSLMVVDFERAEFRGRPPLGSIGTNKTNRKRKLGKLPKQARDDFARELESAVGSVSRWVARLPKHAVTG